MENKLQQLTQKLYDEGLEKGRAEAERLVAEAKTQAAAIVEEARNQAAGIVKQAVSKIKAELSGAIVARSISEGVKQSVADPAFLKEMLLAVARNWNGADAGKVELRALLPEAQRKEFDAAFAASVKELLAAGIEVGYSKDVKSGFKVAAKDGGYYISFSDADFDALLGEYLRDKVSELLFKAE